MTRSYFELLILLLNLAGAAALAVIAGVLHKAMLTLDERTFRNFLKPLHKGAQRRANVSTRAAHLPAAPA